MIRPSRKKNGTVASFMSDMVSTEKVLVADAARVGVKVHEDPEEVRVIIWLLKGVTYVDPLVALAPVGLKCCTDPIVSNVHLVGVA